MKLSVVAAAQLSLLPFVTADPVYGVKDAFTGTKLQTGVVLAEIELPDIATLELATDQDLVTVQPIEVVEQTFDYGAYGMLKTFAYKEGSTTYLPGAGGIMEIDLDKLPPTTRNTDDAVIGGAPDWVTGGAPDTAFVSFKTRLCNRLTENYPHPIYGTVYPLDECHNEFHDWSVCNVHTHGLFVDAEEWGDEVTMRIARGGLCLDYEYRMPKIHYPGIHWYHPHKHGASSLQLGGGLAGIIEVKNTVYNWEIPPWFQTLIDNARMVQFHRIDVEHRLEFQEEEPDLNSPDYFLNNQQVLDPINGFTSMYLVNGIAMPKLTLQANEYKMVRLLHVDQDADYRNFRFGDCDAWLVGRDGIWRRNGPVKLDPIFPRNNFRADQECKNLDSSNETVVEQYLLPGATRADIVLNCPAGTVQTITVDCEPVMTIETTATPITNEFDYRALLDETAENNGFATMYEARPDYIHESKSGLDGTSFDSGDPDTSGNYVEIQVSNKDVTGPNYDGAYSRMQPNVILDLGTVYLFDLANGQNGHPFHMHISPIMVIGECGGDVDYYDIGEFFDVVQARCPTKFKSVWYPATQIMHCHILEHEDVGAMGWVQVGRNYTVPCWEDGSVTRSDAVSGDLTIPEPFPGHFYIDYCESPTGSSRVVSNNWKDHCPQAAFGADEPSPKRWAWQRDNFDGTTGTIDDQVFTCDPFFSD